MEEKNSVRRAIERVFGVLGDPKTHCFVKGVEEADLVIFDDVKAIASSYSQSKTYALIDCGGNKPKNLPANVTDVLSATNIMVELISLIQKVELTLKPLEASKAELIVTEVPLHPDAKRILVIEDTPKHQVSAKAGLAGHKLTVVTSYEEAMKILESEKFDIVLTDLQMPMSSMMLNPNAFKLGELVPYGILLMIEAAHRGAKRVALVTDISNHAQHNNWLVRALDNFLYPMKIEKAKVLMMHAPMRMDADGERVKDWSEALNQLMKA
jgi:CheY-like chemotaxis protein